ncbi:hypothetical protein HPP92_017295 [Vanilla planifolia]|uniref:EF-hand domain-containing protein n=1 Tax=Vanilla planifolia TaxID=51239 RepID=A0A835QHR8_VANPL|nr:hypothetical protein HPP92_017295 [Vanilla planifolia]
MSVEILDGDTIRRFVADEAAFGASIEARFAGLDTDNDGLLSFEEMENELSSLRVVEVHFGVDDEAVRPDELAKLHRGLFARFDRDGDGRVDMEEFREEMREVLLAVAAGLGFLPVQMVVEDGSFLKLAVEREKTQQA